MNHKKNSTKLYNVLFPVWMLFLFPQLWLYVLPGNFIIDSLVLIVSMCLLKVAEKKQMYKKHIFKIFLFGMLSDLIGAAYMLLLMGVFRIGQTGDEFYLTVPALLITAALIFVFNYFITFKKTDNALRFRLSIIFALATAPYTFLIPTSWMHG